MKLVVGGRNGFVGELVKDLTWDAVTDPDKATFTCVISAAETDRFKAGNYRAVVWRTDSNNEDLPVANGTFQFTDAARPT